ncbi:ryncolin-1-like [Saccostrea cucullata]|uniref:ryncolin-1-like n=1 Tax=Saccostrea cuccullata TaxID=36930 RepID=UPI002ECFF784
MPKDCNDLCEDGQTSTGVYNIYPYGTLAIPVNVFCDMSTMGGGWTVIQKRVDGSESFDRNWEEYKNGFGSPERNVWVGNDVIHQLTKEGTSFLYVTITLQNGTTLYEMYDGFSVSDETGKYQLFLAGPATGTLELENEKDSENIRNISIKKNKYSPITLSKGLCYFDAKSTPGFLQLICLGCTSPPRTEITTSVAVTVLLSTEEAGGSMIVTTPSLYNGQWSPALWNYPWNPTVKSGTSVKETTMMIRRH